MRIRRRRSSARSLPRKPRDPRQDPCRGRPRCHGKTLSGAPARLLPKTSAGPQPGPHPPRLHRHSHTAASPPTRRAPVWRCAASRPTQQALVWWHADLHHDHKHVRSDEDQKTATLGGIFAEESHKTPGKILAGDDCAPQQDPCRAPGKTLAEDICRAAVRPTSTKAPSQLPCSC